MDGRIVRLCFNVDARMSESGLWGHGEAFDVPLVVTTRKRGACVAKFVGITGNQIIV